MDFKYGIKSVESGLFKLARLPELNDPNEMRGVCIGELKENVVQELLEEAEEKRRKGMMANGKPVLPREEIERNVRQYAIERLTEILMRRDSMEERSRVLCFTRSDIDRTWADQLFWAHYSRGGRGIRALIDVDVHPSDGYVVNQVRYSDVRPTLDVSKFDHWMDRTVFDAYFRECLFTKGTAWQYEQEVRLLTFAGAPLLHAEYHKGKALDFIRIPQERILRIDFGPMTYREQTDSVVAKLRQCEKTRHIEFHFAHFEDRGYGYVYPQYDCSCFDEAGNPSKYACKIGG